MRLRVAFLDGSIDLHRDIAEATKQITNACNLELDFGVDEQTGEFRRWTEDVTDHAAEIRVSFDQTGFWSRSARTAPTRPSVIRRASLVAIRGSAA